MPIIALSENPEEQMVRSLIVRGVDDIVTLPAEGNSFAGRLRQQIDQPLHYFQTDTYFGPDRRRSNDRGHPERRGGQNHTFQHFIIQRNPSNGIRVVFAQTHYAGNRLTATG